jgi:cobalt-zinc-cadmium efflux system membrane fusion protein
MKRAVIVPSAILLALGLIGLGATVARPSWVPSWMRFGRTAPAVHADAGLHCKEHGVPEKFCTLCHEELTTALVLCKEHGGIPEEICTRCHPEAQQKFNIAMCRRGHGLPGEFCVGCGKAACASAALPDDGWCATHNQPELQCPECAGNPRTIGPVATGEVPSACRQPLPAVKLASARLVRQLGFETAVVTEEIHGHRLMANAETAYDANRFAEISPRVVGFLREVRADLGQAVRLGEVLAVVDSAEVSAAKAQILTSHAAARLAQAAYDRTHSLTQAGVVATKMELEALTTLNQAQASAMDAEQRLRNLRFDDSAMGRILETRDTSSLLDIISPIGGAVVLRHAVQGEAVQPTSQMFSVADTSRMWLWVDVYESDIAKVAPGQPVSFTISGIDPAAEGPTFAGQVTWVGTEVNPTTRTTRIRAELGNLSGRLRANQFGLAEILVGKEHKALVVPRAAVQRKDNANLVFLPEDEPGRFRAQRVVIKPTDRNDVVEVAWGLKAGQRVVTRGAFLLKTEIMKGAIGAGCCE